MKKMVILTGPTAVGKTSLSIDLAKKIDGEIVSADSIQVYKKLDIGSAKITESEMGGVKHHLIDVLDPGEEFSVHTFKEMALNACEKIWDKGKIPVIVGGTGFYIQALLYDIDFSDEESNSSYRKELQEIADTKGEEYLHDMLREVDPQSADAIHKNNVKRVIRALEYYHDNNAPISKHNEEQRKNSSPYNFAYFVLNDDRAVLYDRINRRVDIMMEQGVVDEVKRLKAQGIDENMQCMQGIGYKEILEYLDGKYSLDEATLLIKKNTRHFAKRQLTWFRREKETIFVNKNEFKDETAIMDYILGILKDKDII